MALTLDQLFGLESLASMITLFADQSPRTRLQSLFPEDPSFACDGDTVKWDELTFGRGLAPFVARDGKAATMEGQDVTVRHAGLATIKMKEFIPASEIVYQRGLGNGSNVRETAPARVTRAMRGLMNKLILTKEKLCADALAGSITIDAATYPGSEVTYPAVTYAVQTFTAGASWATAGTKILSSATEILAIKRAMRENAGDDVSRLLFNAKTATYLLGNTEIQGWLQTTMPGISVFQSGQLGAQGGAGGIPGWEEYDEGYKPDGGSYTRFLADDKFVALPRDPETAGLVMATGYGIIPARSGLLTGRSAEQLMPERASTPGFFSYAYVDVDPVGVWLVVGWRGFPIVRRPDGIIFGDVTP